MRVGRSWQTRGGLTLGLEKRVGTTAAGVVAQGSEVRCRIRASHEGDAAPRLASGSDVRLSLRPPTLLEDESRGCGSSLLTRGSWSLWSRCPEMAVRFRLC